MDEILDHLSIFWAKTEVVLDVLTKKGEHAEQFIRFSQKPKLMARFKERLEEYRRFWEGVRTMAANYIAGVQIYQTNPESDQRMYGFLEKKDSNAVLSTKTPSGISFSNANVGYQYDSNSSLHSMYSSGTTSGKSVFSSGLQVFEN